MNKKQRITVFIGIVIIFLMLLVPPWQSLPGRFGGTNFEGYGFIFAPDARFKLKLDDGIYFSEEYGSTVSIDWSRLVIQFLLVIIATGGFVFLFHRPKADQIPPSKGDSHA